MTVSTPNILERLVQRVSQLYTLPAVALQVIELTSGPAIDVEALRECIARDPALTAKILRVINSSAYGLRAEILDLHQALTLMGTQPLRLLVLGLSLPAGLFDGIESRVLNHYWRIAMIKAVAAREICRTCWGKGGDTAFIAGLLQDVGILAMVRELGEPYVTFLNQVIHDRRDIIANEISTMGFDHRVLSAGILREWGLPSEFVQSLAANPTSNRSFETLDGMIPLPKALHAAHLLAEFLVLQNPALLTDVIEFADQHCGLTQEQIDSLVDGLDQQVSELAIALGLSSEGEPFRDVLVQAYAELSKVAERVATDLLEPATPESLLDQTNELRQLVAGTQVVPAEPVSQGGESMREPSHESSAALDPMDPGLAGMVASEVAMARRKRGTINLAIAEIDEFDSLFSLLGTERALECAELLARLIPRQTGADRIVRIHDARFAIFLRDLDRRPAYELVRQLATSVRDGALTESCSATLSLSIGLATLDQPPRNFPAEELIEAAERCLNGVKLSGGDGIKSRDIF